MSAALVLARCKRRVLVCDVGNPRNARSCGVHGFLSRDGILPANLIRCGREELARYDVEVRKQAVMAACGVSGGFAVTLRDATVLECRKLLLATGVVDQLPAIKGIDRFYGTSVHHCPYCDGWEHRDTPIAVYGRGSGGAALSLAMKTWSEDVILVSNGAARLSEGDKAKMKRFSIEVYEQKIAGLEGLDGKLERIVLQDGTELRRQALFFSTGNAQRSQLPVDLGCKFNRKGAVTTKRTEESSVPGLWVAGDASHDAQFVVVAAAEGAKAAMAINKALQEEDQS